VDDKREQDHIVDWTLRRVYEQAAPADSWQDLRGRIDGRLARPARSHPAILWKRTAMALAACLVVTLGSLCYVLMRTDRGAVAAPLLTQEQLDRLEAVFGQIRGVFADDAAWFVVDSAGRTQMGVSGPAAMSGGDERVVVLRVALSDGEAGRASQYVDVIAKVQRMVDVQVALRDGGSVRLSLVPELTDGGSGVAVGGVAVPQASYASIGRVRAGDRWLQLHATARIVPI
jgi:hypothetical protein